MPKVFLSPSNQFGNRYAWGNTNEGKQCGLVANLLKVALERHGIQVMLMHDQSMSDKVNTANNWGADLYIPIHSNACNGSVAGTRMFCWDKSSKGYIACMDIFRYLAPLTPGESESIKVDQTLYEVKWPNAPTAYVEIDFHDVPDVARWIVEHKPEIAEAICHGVCDYFNIKYVPVSVPSVSNTCTVELPILCRGDNGDYVKTLQLLLNYYNNAGLTVDGLFGSGTESALIKWQRSRNLTADGKCGAKSWQQLLK